MAARRRVVAMINPRQSYTGTAANLSSCSEVPLGELVPFALLAVLVARPVVYGLTNFFEDFLRLLDPPGLFQQQGITGACFLARVISQRGIFIKCRIRIP